MDNLSDKSTRSPGSGEIHSPGDTAVVRISRIARGTSSDVRSDAAYPWAREPGDGMWRDSLLVTWARRLVTIPAVFVLTAVYGALLPLIFLFTIPADLIRKNPLLLTRFHAHTWAVVAWHCVGLGILFSVWLFSGRCIGMCSDTRWRRWNRTVEGAWGSGAIGVPETFYGMRMVSEGEECLDEGGPVLVFARHASVIDTMLPLRVLEHWKGLTARIVKKDVLLWDPCVDIVSHRLPRTLVKRGSSNPTEQVKRLHALTAGMGPRDGLWIFPEGTRFTPKKKARIVEKLATSNPAAAKRASEFQSVLPPRPAGTNALLQQCRGMDIVFCAHTGLEGANRVENIINGSLYKRRLQVKFWRVPASEVPTHPAEASAWFHEHWRRVDQWVAEHQDPDLRAMLADE